MSHFSFYVLCFFFYKVGEQEGRTGSGVGSSAPVGGRRWHERFRRMNMVQTCIHMYVDEVSFSFFLVTTEPNWA
jgi:hypothetical protein